MKWFYYPGNALMATLDSGGSLTLPGTLAVTGAATFSAIATFNAVANNNAAYFKGSTTTNQSYGPYIDAGTSSSDYAFYVRDVTGANAYFKIRGDGNVGIGTASPRTVTDIRTGADGVLSIANTTETSGKYTGIRFGNYSVTDGFYNAGILYKSTGDGASRGDLIIAMNTASNGVNATAANAVVTFAGATGIPTFSTTVKASDFVLT